MAILSIYSQITTITKLLIIIMMTATVEAEEDIAVEVVLTNEVIETMEVIVVEET